MLFFGCQNEKHHFLYADEIRSAKDRGALTHLSVAASRDQVRAAGISTVASLLLTLSAEPCQLLSDVQPEKIYVQHHIKKHAADVHRLLVANATVYVCGYASRC